MKLLMLKGKCFDSLLILIVLCIAIDSTTLVKASQSRAFKVTAPGTVTFSRAIFDQAQHQVLYLGASALGAGFESYALSRAFLGSSGSVAMQGIAPQSVRIGFGDAVPSPMYNHLIKNLDLLGHELVVTLDGATAPDGGAKIYLATGPEVGAVLYTHSDALKDAGGVLAANNVTSEIPALATSPLLEYIFAAVPAAGRVFDDPLGINRGVTVLKKDMLHGCLTPVTPLATKLDLTASFGSSLKPFAVGQGAELVSDLVAMTWSEELQRLFVALHVKRSNQVQPGTIMILAVGRFDVVTGNFVFSPFIPGSPTAVPNLFTLNSQAGIVGFRADNTGLDLMVGVRHLRVMATTTGKYYLIINGFIGDNNNPAVLNEGIYGVPLNGKTYANGTTIPEPLIGTLAKTDFSSGALQPADIPLRTDIKARVGGFNNNNNLGFPFIARNAQDLVVQGDTVYCFMADNRESRHVGILESTALFDRQGIVTGWTPARHVAGTLIRAAGGGYDWSTGKFYALTEEPAYDSSLPVPVNIAYKSVAVTSWGASDVVTTQPFVNELSSLLTTLFPQEKGGVYQLFGFNEFYPNFFQPQVTPSLDDINSSVLAPALSMVIATGNSRVALIQTGKADVVTGEFYPLKRFFTQGLNQNVFVFDNPALQACGPITAATIAQDTFIGGGWVFVGGLGGVAVLRAPATGLGYQAAAGLTDLSNGVNNFPGVFGDHTFKQLAPSTDPRAFNNVRALLASRDAVVIVTEHAVHGIQLDGTNATYNKFLDAGATALGEMVMIPATAGYTFNDALILRNGNNIIHVFATTKGLFIARGNQEIQPLSTSALVPTNLIEVPVDGMLGKSIMQLAYVSDQNGYAGTSGQLYVLVSDRTVVGPEVAVYRFAISGNAATLAQVLQPVEPLNGLIKKYSSFVGSILCEGNVLHQIRGKNFEDGSFSVISPRHVPLFERSLASDLGLDGKVNYSAGIACREPASGTILLPGDWGVRVRE